MPAAAPSSTLDAGVVLTLDVGTSSVRCLAFDVRGEPVPGWVAQHAHLPRTATDGTSELDAPPLLERSVEVLAAVSAQAGAQGVPILAVAVCGFWHAVLAVDASDEPLTPVLLWNDMRAAAAARALQDELDGAAVHARTGCVLHPSFLPARLRWLRDAQPDAFRRAHRFVSFGEYLEARLLGRQRIGVSMASGTGLFDQRALTWDAEVLAAVPLEPERLSPLLPEHRPAAGLRPPYAKRLPGLREAPFFPSLGDGACANLGSGATVPRLGALMIATGAAMRAWVGDGATPPPRGLWRYLLDPRRALIGGALSNGGNLFGWLQRTLRLPPPEELEAALLDARPAGHGLRVLPFLAGERNPDYPLSAQGMFAGLTSATTATDLVQAALESVAFRLAAVLERLRPAAPRMAALIASGGFLRSRARARVLADALGIPLHLSTVGESSSRGAALLALEALGQLPAADALPPQLGESIEPDPDRHARYAEARAAHEALYAQHVQPGV